MHDLSIVFVLNPKEATHLTSTPRTWGSLNSFFWWSHNLKNNIPFYIFRVTEKEGERERDRDRDGDREIFHLLVHSPDTQEPEDSSGSFTWLQRPPALGLSSTAFLGALVRNWVESGTAKTCIEARIGSWNIRWRLSMLGHHAGPHILLSLNI